jgi:hypothetical protein
MGMKMEDQDGGNGKGTSIAVGCSYFFSPGFFSPASPLIRIRMMARLRLPPVHAFAPFLHGKAIVLDDFSQNPLLTLTCKITAC